MLKNSIILKLTLGLGALGFLCLAGVLFFSAPSCSLELEGCYYGIDPVSKELAFKYQIYHSLTALFFIGSAIIQLVMLNKLITKS